MVLSIINLSVKLGDQKAVDNLSFDMNRGEVVGLLGPNGAGKSTLMRAITHLQLHDGSISIDGKDPAALSSNERARLVAYLPQTRTIGWRITVRDLVALGRMPFRAFGTRESATDREAIEAALELTDTQHLASRIASELSGGEQARVLTARAVAQTTPLMVADEPASGLDPAHQIMLMQALRRLASQGRSVLVSLHDLTLAARWCDRVVLLDKGSVADEGRPDKVFTRQRLATVYGVRTQIAHSADGLVITPTDLVER
ncbi:ABC transporter ATP-binding protein [Nitratireductor sp. CH_MIT9313-5]|uniref:ABC transporter ATP-binding protein n=1 Tax=Nitratireductor sp. CH_MIT9313-5 TaxID=3107764 RepID=UPI0030083429